MIKHDRLYRYLFENHSVRGELVTVNKAYSEILKNHNYPLPVQQLLGEMLVATSLLTATLKFDGEITVQLQGDGPLSLAVINGNNFQQMRGVARVKSDISDGSSLKQMMGNGYLVITITPTQGERYQGIIGLEGETLAECIERYFSQSEQLPTRFFIRTGARSEQPMAGGMLLQVLPASNENGDEFEHLATLTATINAEELFNLEAEEVLYRLYHEEEVTLFEAQSVNFHCTCSRERCADTLMALPADEVDTMLAEDGQIEMNCDFCASQYSFDAVDIKSIRNGHGSVEADSSSIH